MLQQYTSCQFCPNVTQLYLIKGISAPGNGKEVVDGLNVITKRFMYKLMSNVQLPRSKIFDSQILMHSCTPEKDVSLAKKFQKHLSKKHNKHGVIELGKIQEMIQ